MTAAPDRGPHGNGAISSPPTNLSVSTVLFDGYPLGLALDEIAKAGLAHAELAYIDGYTKFDESSFEDANARHVARQLRQAGIVSIALSAHINVGLPDAVERLSRRLRFAHQIGASILITNSAPKSLGKPFLRNMAAVAPLCEELGVTVALENPGHGTDDLIGSGAAGAALIRRIGSDHVRLNYDFGNVFTYNREALDVVEDMGCALRFMVHGHVKDVLSNASGWHFVAAGDGTVNLGPIAAKLARLAPAMPMALEMPLRLQRPCRGNPVRAAEPVPLADIRRALARANAFWTTATQAGIG